MTDTTIDKTAKPLLSGVYRFELSELAPGPVRVAGRGDPHLVATLETENESPEESAGKLRALSTAARISFTPDNTADRLINSASQ